MKNNIKKKLLISFTSIFFLTPLIVSAQGDINILGNYINNLYLTAIGLSGLLAVIMIVAGAAYLTISGASPDKQKEGKSYITAALLGLMLLLGAFVLLNTINPELVELQDPYDPNFDLPDGQQAGGAGAGVGGINVNDLDSDSTTAERRAAYCSNANQEYIDCRSKNELTTVAIPGSSVDVVNCDHQHTAGAWSYNCLTNLNTDTYLVPSYDIQNEQRELEWTYYFTEKGPVSMGGGQGVTSRNIQPNSACLVSKVGSESVAIKTDKIGQCPMP